MSIILTVLAVHLLLGLSFGIPFVIRGIARVDPAARGSSWTFRLLVLPGVAALWPVMWIRWRRAARHTGNPS